MSPLVLLASVSAVLLGALLASGKSGPEREPVRVKRDR